MKIELDIKITAKDLYLFNIRQAYKGMQGFLSILLPVLVFAYAWASVGKASTESIMVYVAVGVVFLVYVPVSLWLRVSKIMKDENNALTKTLHYTFEEEAIHVAVEEEQVDFQWENIFQMKTAGKHLLVYTNRINAYILPLAQVGDKYAELSKLAHSKLQKHRVSMR